MSSLTWIGVCAAAVAIVPAWTPPTWYLIGTGILLAIIAVRAVNGKM
jgi:hypothetical protein